MRRRHFIAGLAGASLPSRSSLAPSRPLSRYSVCSLSSHARPEKSSLNRSVHTCMRWVTQRARASRSNSASRIGNPQRLPEIAAQLVAIKPAVIATFGDAAARAREAATTNIPIVAQSEDLARANLVISMRQPEGNITGVSIMGTELDAKRLEILANCCRRGARCCCSLTQASTGKLDPRSMRPPKPWASRSRRRLWGHIKRLSRHCVVHERKAWLG